MRSRSSESVWAQIAKRGKGAFCASREANNEQKQYLEAGGTAPLRELPERGTRELLWLATLAQSSRLTDEPDQGILVRHKVSLQDGHVARGQPVHGHALEPQPF